MNIAFVRWNAVFINNISFLFSVQLGVFWGFVPQNKKTIELSDHIVVCLSRPWDIKLWLNIHSP